MRGSNLRELYLAELNDLYDAEQQVLCELPLLAAQATSGGLRELFDAHYRETQQHVVRLEHLFREMEERPRHIVCRVLRAIVEDGRARHATALRGEALDAALIAMAERIEHYEIAAYGCAHAYAVSIGDAAGAGLLRETLDEEVRMDEKLRSLAMAGSLATAGGRPMRRGA